MSLVKNLLAGSSPADARRRRRENAAAVHELLEKDGCADVAPDLKEFVKGWKRLADAEVVENREGDLVTKMRDAAANTTLRSPGYTSSRPDAQG